MALSGSGHFAYSVPVDRVHANVQQELIYITEDKLRNILRDYTDVLQKKEPLLAVFSTLVTLIAALATSEPNCLLPSDAWRAAVIMLTFAALVWFGYCVVRYAKFRRSPMSGIDGVIGRIKGSIVKEPERTDD